MKDIRQDSDVARYCLQIDSGDGLPVSGIVLEFSTTVSDGLNLFGKSLGPADSNFSPSSFANKIHAVGVSFNGYKGISNPNTNSAIVGGLDGDSPSSPGGGFLDPNGLSATPYVYLIPIGVDSMRSPPLGDASAVRSWNINDVAVPMPFNIGGSDLNEKSCGNRLILLVRNCSPSESIKHFVLFRRRKFLRTMRGWFRIIIQIVD